MDDNVDAAISLATLVRLWGYEAFLAADGPEALAAAHEHRPDVVLLDIGLPRIDGYGVAQYLRSHPYLGRPLIIAVTGYGQARDRVRAIECGFDYFLVKPCELSVLRELLARAEMPEQEAVPA